MLVRLKHIAPVRLGIVYGILYTIAGLVIGIVVALADLNGLGGTPGIHRLSLGWLSVIVYPILYGVLGLVIGIIGAWLYNFVASWTGGIEMTFETQAAAVTQTST